MMRQRLKRQSVLTIFRRGRSSLSFFNPTFNSRIEKVFFSGKYFKSIFGLKHSTLMIMIAPNSYARREVKKGKVKVEHGGIRGKEEGIIKVIKYILECLLLSSPRTYQSKPHTQRPINNNISTRDRFMKHLHLGRLNLLFCS